MAIPPTFRLLFLSSLFPFLGLLNLAAAPHKPPPLDSWYDQRLSTHIQKLMLRAGERDERSALVSIALLDEIYELYENVSEPVRVDFALSAIARSENTAPAVHAEAQYLRKLISDGVESPGISNDPAKAFVDSALQRLSKDDVELVDAVGEIRIFHRWNDNNGIETAAEAANTAEGWFRASRVASDFLI